ncbi:MAG: UDP-glucose/GDP-mannose dehydrogenase family protein [Planctomycetes bacterium]|nr:UDP-glucose/GDP-mannose dehydrogenase family protein [Planctomycetota bacterium]MCD7896120.1 UDP-glucose/GDP-mannose dehydrogenase family protein [Planctomycetaceae bacterium]
MNISIVGTGYVGLVCGAGLAEMGNKVICVDNNQEKIQLLQNGEIPIYESGLAEVVRGGIENNTLSFTSDIRNAVRDSEICFIAVGTPMGEDGSAYLDHVYAVAADIGMNMTGYMCVVNKSTVPVGTADKVQKIISKQLEARGEVIEFDVVSNPEFLKAGTALNDFVRPDRVIIGSSSDRAIGIMKELYAPFIRNHDRMLVMDVRSSEMTKYTANAMLANRISFINEIANICEHVGADINKVRLGIGSDSRIGYHFLYPGCGYGGSCFPKDVRALIATAEEHHYDTPLLRSVELINKRQKEVLAEKVVQHFGNTLNNKVFAVWGLAFKPGTDDMREAPAINTIERLTKLGASIQAYDPKAITAAQRYYLKDNTSVQYFDSKYAALRNVDALLLLTEWKEFRTPDFDEMKKLMKHAIIFDGRNQYDSIKMKSMDFEYHQIGCKI